MNSLDMRLTVLLNSLDDSFWLGFYHLSPDFRIFYARPLRVLTQTMATVTSQAVVLAGKD